jgi:hypothetical protein
VHGKFAWHKASEHHLRATVGMGLAPVLATKEQALKLSLPFLTSFVLGWVRPVGSLDQLAALSDGPLEMPGHVVAGRDFQ